VRSVGEHDNPSPATLYFLFRTKIKHLGLSPKRKYSSAFQIDGRVVLENVILRLATEFTLN